MSKIYGKTKQKFINFMKEQCEDTKGEYGYDDEDFYPETYREVIKGKIDKDEKMDN